MLPSTGNGSITSRTSGPYSGGLNGYNATVTYACNVGYWFAPGLFNRTTNCLSSGNWSSIGACTGFIIIMHVCQLPIDKFICCEAFYYKFVKLIELVMISVVDCGSIPNVANAIVASSFPAESTYYNTFVTYSCKPLFWFNRDVFTKSISCLSTGNWTVNNNICQRKNKVK